MSSFSVIQQKLEQFIKKYYTNELIKGSILFLAIGLLYFLITLLIEYFLWLEPLGRSILFWLFIAVESALFIRFIAFPLSKLFNLQKGISFEEASKLIGNHFPEVSDKLLNVIQLNQNQRESELLLASIDQKSTDLEPIPFKRAINFKKNSKYLKYAAIPVIIFLLIQVLGEKDIFSSSYTRVVNYDTAYEPPAPFSFTILNESLQAIENKGYTVKVQTKGEVIPENASISYNTETYYLHQIAPGLFEYTFLQPKESIDFNFSANNVTSKEFTLNVVKTPSLSFFEMKLDYPSYIGKKDEVLKSTGNATIPEGTKVTWDIYTKNTNEVNLKTKDTAYAFSILKNKESDESLGSKTFSHKRNVYRKFDYTITTSNNELKDYENLSFTLGVVLDQYPEINVESKKDSTDSQKVYFFGKVSDDYGLTKLQLIYYPVGDESQKEVKPLTISSNNFDEFVHSFPGDIILKDGVAYEYYFEVFDNDVLHNYKSSKSSMYFFKKLTQDEKEKEQLQNQENTIKGLDKSLEKLKNDDKALQELSKTQKEKKELNWNDKKKLENFIKRQQQQEEMMKNFSKELKDNLENFQPENEEDPFKEQLKERLEENEERLKKNEKLLEELEKLKDKIKKEELTDKLEKLAKQNKNQEKNLEQLVELTKRYYVTKKAEKLSDELFKLAEEQEKLADSPKEENTKEEQEKLNEKFEDYKKDMDDLQKENEELKKPMEIPQDKVGEKIVQKEQENASEKLKEENQSGASENQKKAAKKMKEMSQQMQAQMMAGAGESLEEDLEMLRQVLDNLVVFSFEQEHLMEEFKTIEYGNAIFGKKLNKQNDLKLNFKHIDDSLFVLALRQPLISETINSSLTNIEFNIDKSLDRLAQNQVRQGISNQQYTVTNANELAVLLSDLLGNMQNQMGMGMGQGKGKGKGQGQGKGKGFQLSDIIEKQESLSDKMEKGGKKGKDKGEGEGESEGEGEGQGEGQGQGDGQGEGEGDGDGKNGKNGNKEGKNGQGDSEEMNGELFEIYKEQQMLRQQLQDKLSKEGLKGRGGDLLREMEGIEQQLLDKGFNDRTLERMLNLKYELLKLDKANFKQGQESKRESQTNRTSYQNELRTDPELIKKYFNTIEILNREALPLRQEYKQKVQEYFKKKND
ncbi:MAG: hypothetical protein KUG68_05295 [Flavobacteriaceae bacterium]|nr:hypothetical protein [Flavobacteriaceae bacterium]